MTEQQHGPGSAAGGDGGGWSTATARQAVQRRSVSSKIAEILLSFGGRGGQSMTAVAHCAHLPISTAHRLLNELVVGGLLDRDDDGKYRPSSALRLLPGPADPAATARSLVDQTLEDLAAVTGCRARFGVMRDHGGVSYLERPARGGPCVAGLDVLPAHATALGKALLAHAPPGVVDRVIRGGLPAYAVHAAKSEGQLRRALSTARTSGLAVSREQSQDGPCAVAAPVIGPGGFAIAAIGTAVPDIFNGMRLAGPVLIVAARQLSRRLAEVPAALPPETGSAPLQWRADPTSLIEGAGPRSVAAI
jgi:DNA-binding IclR family transcriptional regulator